MTATLLTVVILVRGQDHPAHKVFEVASVKAAPPSDPGRLQDLFFDHAPVGFIPTTAGSSRVSIKDTSLATLIALAYRVRVSAIVGPHWMSEESFNIEANIPTGEGAYVHEMMQSLLEERFGLRLHSGKKEDVGYALVVGKDGPKLRLSTATLMSKANEPDTHAQVERDLRKTEERNRAWLRMKHTTTAELAHNLSGLLKKPVFDLTNVQGVYDVDLATSPAKQVQEFTVEDPGAWLIEAVKELGLRLERRKLLLDVLVVESVNKVPTQN